MVRSLLIVPENPLHEFSVKTGRVEKIRYMIVHELLLDGAIKSLTVRVHLRCSRIGMPVGLVEETKSFIRSLLSLRGRASSRR